MTKQSTDEKASGRQPVESTLYAELKAAGIETSSHESDLYFPATPEAMAILDRYPLNKSNAQRFINQAEPHKGETWIDAPFAFIPFWEKVSRRNAKN